MSCASVYLNAPQGKTNVLKGEIQHGKDTRYTLEGPCGQTITLYDNELVCIDAFSLALLLRGVFRACCCLTGLLQDEEEQLLDYERIGHQRLHYDASHDDMDSIEIWKVKDATERGWC